MSTSSAKYDQLKEGVSSKTVCTMDRSTCSLSSGIKARHNLITSFRTVLDCLLKEGVWCGGVCVCVCVCGVWWCVCVCVCVCMCDLTRDNVMWG